MKPKRTHDNNPSKVKYKEYHTLWNIIEGAVVDAMKHHPDYFTKKGLDSLTTSITKRVVGAVIHNAKRTRKGGRLGGCEKSDTLQACRSGSHELRRGTGEDVATTRLSLSVLSGEDVSVGADSPTDTPSTEK
jgi:hypothetical protein